MNNVNNLSSSNLISENKINSILLKIDKEYILLTSLLIESKKK